MCYLHIRNGQQTYIWVWYGSNFVIVAFMSDLLSNLDVRLLSVFSRLNFIFSFLSELWVVSNVYILHTYISFENWNINKPTTEHR